MKKRKQETSDNIIKQVDWEFVNGEVKVTKIKYMESASDKRGTAIKTSGSELDGSCSHMDE